jgi:hypothetical protein
MENSCKWYDKFAEKVAKIEEENQAQFSNLPAHNYHREQVRSQLPSLCTIARRQLRTELIIFGLSEKFTFALVRNGTLQFDTDTVDHNSLVNKLFLLLIRDYLQMTSHNFPRKIILVGLYN